MSDFSSVFGNTRDLVESAFGTSFSAPNNIKVKTRHGWKFCVPRQVHSGEWADLVLSEPTTLKAGEFKYLDLGVCMQLPAGYEAIVAPRSSTFKKFGLIQTNSIGVIDNAYRGNEDWWKFPALATRDVEIPAGTRICQFRIQEQQPDLKFIIVNEFEDTENRGGLGSTGV